MKKSISSALFIALLLSSPLFAVGERAEIRKPYTAPKRNLAPRVEVPRAEHATPQRVVKTRGVISFADAKARTTHARHDRVWWAEHFRTIMFGGTGYYYLDGGYWYPAFGFDPAYDSYAYDGPIYAFGGLAPDQEIASVQAKLQQDGYYAGLITGVLDATTREALAKFQADNDLLATGAIDQPTAEALALA